MQTNDQLKKLENLNRQIRISDVIECSGGSINYN